MGIWPQAAAEHLAVNEMLGNVSNIPCFAGDLNNHLVIHTHVRHDGFAELHVAQHEDTIDGKKLAVAYMKELMTRNLAVSQHQHVLGFTGDVLPAHACHNRCSS